MLRANIMHDCIQLLIGKRDEQGEWVGWKEQVSICVHVYITVTTSLCIAIYAHVYTSLTLVSTHIIPHHTMYVYRSTSKTLRSCASSFPPWGRCWRSRAEAGQPRGQQRSLGSRIGWIGKSVVLLLLL